MRRSAMFTALETSAMLLNKRRQRLLDHVHRVPVLVDGQMLIRSVIERAVARTISDDRALPHGSDDVHIAGARLQDEAKLLRCIDGAKAGEKTSHERVVAITSPRFLITAELQIKLRPAGVLACRLAGLL